MTEEVKDGVTLGEEDGFDVGAVLGSLEGENVGRAEGREDGVLLG